MTKNRLKSNLDNISEVFFERKLHTNIQTNQEYIKRKKLPSQKIFQTINSDQVMLNDVILKEDDDIFMPSSHNFLNIPI